MQEKLGVDLSHRKEEIDRIIMADVDQVNSHSDEEQSEEEVPKGKDDSESEPESEVRKVNTIMSVAYINSWKRGATDESNNF